MKYNTFIFDLDGTLLDTLDDLMDSVNYALDQFGYPIRTRKEIRQFVGNGVANLMERAIPNGKNNPDLEACLTTFKEHYSIHMQDKTAPYEGIMDTLSALKEAGCKMAIVSNKFDSAVKELNRQYFAKYIDVAIGESSTVEKKPAPDTALQAMKELHVTTEGTVYVGDSDVDIQTAKNAGLPCISATWGFRDKEFLIQHGSVYFADSPAELLLLNKKS